MVRARLYAATAISWSSFESSHPMCTIGGTVLSADWMVILPLLEAEVSIAPTTPVLLEVVVDKTRSAACSTYSTFGQSEGSCFRYSCVDWLIFFVYSSENLSHAAKSLAGLL